MRVIKYIAKAFALFIVGYLTFIAVCIGAAASIAALTN